MLCLPLGKAFSSELLETHEEGAGVPFPRVAGSAQPGTAGLFQDRGADEPWALEAEQGPTEIPGSWVPAESEEKFFP